MYHHSTSVCIISMFYMSMKYKTLKNKQHKTSKLLESLSISATGLKIVLSLSAAWLPPFFYGPLDSRSSLWSCPLTLPQRRRSSCLMKIKQHTLLRSWVWKKSVLGCGEELQVWIIHFATFQLYVFEHLVKILPKEIFSLCKIRMNNDSTHFRSRLLFLG